MTYVAGPHGITIPDVWETVNENIKIMGLSVRSMVFDDDGDTYYAVVNTVNDDVAKETSGFTEPQLLYFKALVRFTLGDCVPACRFSL